MAAAALTSTEVLYVHRISTAWNGQPLVIIETTEVHSYVQTNSLTQRGSTLGRYHPMPQRVRNVSGNRHHVQQQPPDHDHPALDPQPSRRIRQSARMLLIASKEQTHQT